MTRRTIRPYRCAFSFYGGKSKIAHLYPAPIHDAIVEPFAGGASYSLLHHERQVVLGDINPRVASIWRFLLSPGAADLIDRLVPDRVDAGASVSNNLVDRSTPNGLMEIMRAEANHGTMGSNGVRDTVTKMGAKCWPRLKPRLLHWIPRISHWSFIEVPYWVMGDEVSSPSTWFVDPPYANAAGNSYAFSGRDIDYQHLSGWVRALPNPYQVIVCENEGATWLPFTPLVERRGIRSSYQKSRAVEVVYERPGS